MAIQESINSAIGQAGIVAGFAKGIKAQEGVKKATEEATANAKQAEALELEDKINLQQGDIIQSEDAIKGNKRDIKQYKLDLKTAEGRLAEMQAHFAPEEEISAEKEKVNALGLETKDNIKRARSAIKYLKSSVEIARKRQSLLSERLNAIRGGND